MNIFEHPLPIVEQLCHVCEGAVGEDRFSPFLISGRGKCLAGEDHPDGAAIGEQVPEPPPERLVEVGVSSAEVKRAAQQRRHLFGLFHVAVVGAVEVRARLLQRVDFFVHLPDRQGSYSCLVSAPPLLFLDLGFLPWGVAQNTIETGSFSEEHFRERRGK